MSTSIAIDNIESLPGRSGPVPLVDLQLLHARIAHEVRADISRLMDSTAFVLGPEVTAFENKYADFCGVKHCIGVGNGTDAIELALRAIGISSGDEVVIPANTFVATAEAVVRAGGRLVLADCDENYVLDPTSLGESLTSRTRAVIAVDLYGQIADMDALGAVVDDSIAVIEDAAQSHGATRGGRSAGSFGCASATSFYPGKNLGAYGDAGGVLTDDDNIADRVRSLRNHGGQRRYEHNLLGTNSRLDSIQAVVLSIKLQYLRAWNEERCQAAAIYHELLAGCDDLVLPATLPGNSHVWHLYVVRTPRRDDVLARLSEAGIGAGIHYPLPIHRMPAFDGAYVRHGSLSRSERMAEEILSLPIYPGITAAQQEQIADVLLKALRK